MLLAEEWKQVKGYEGIYEISDSGKIRSARLGDIKPHDNGFGWWIMELYKDSSNCSGRGYCKRGGKRFKLHRLVAEHFVPNPKNLRFVMHLDGNKKNCKASNLVWSKTNR